MVIHVRLSDEGDLEEAREEPFERYIFTTWFFVLTPLVIAFPIGLATRNRLTIGRQWFLSLVMTPPLLVGSAIIGWRLSGRFWPGRLLTDEELRQYQMGTRSEIQGETRQESARLKSDEARYWLGWGLSILGIILRQTSAHGRRMAPVKRDLGTFYLPAVLYVLMGIRLLARYLGQKRSG